MLDSASNSTPGSLVAVSVNNGASRALPIPDGEVIGEVQLVRWDERGVHVLTELDGGVRLVDIATNRTLELRPVPSDSTDERALAGHGYAWSADGQRVAYWTAKCLEPSDTDCVALQSVLYVVDVTTGATHPTFVLSSATPQDVALSPDGSTAIYTDDFAVLLKTVP